MATREEKRERGGNEGKDCRRGRGNLKVRGRKEKVVEDKGKERADGGREWTARKTRICNLCTDGVSCYMST